MEPETVILDLAHDLIIEENEDGGIDDAKSMTFDPAQFESFVRQRDEEMQENGELIKFYGYAI